MLQYSQAVFFSGQLVSRFSEARTLRSYTSTASQQANAEDVLAEAKEINRARAEEAFGEEEEAAEDFTDTTEKAEDAE